MHKPTDETKRVSIFKRTFAGLVKQWKIFALILIVAALGVGSALARDRATISINKPDINDKQIATDDVLLKRYVAAYGPVQAITQIKTMPGIDCHQRSHKIGRLNYEVAGSKAFKVLNSECQSGYTHGATEAFFRDKGTNNLSSNLALICQNEENGFYAHQCFHGIGHGLMAFNDYDLPEVLKTCDGLEKRSQSNKESCYSGAFMENVVGAIAVDDAKASKTSEYHTSSYLSDDPLFPCNSVENKYKSTCYFFQSSRMLQILGSDFQKIVSNCEKIEQEYQYNCFSSTGRDVSNSFSMDIAGIEKSCGYAQREEMQLSCIGGATQDKFWDQSEQDEALSLCRGFAKDNVKQRCYIELANRARDIIAKAEDRRAFCAKYETKYTESCTSTL